MMLTIHAMINWEIRGAYHVNELIKSKNKRKLQSNQKYKVKLETISMDFSMLELLLKKHLHPVY